MTDKRLDKDNPDVLFKYKNKSTKREQKNLYYPMRFINQLLIKKFLVLLPLKILN